MVLCCGSLIKITTAIRSYRLVNNLHQWIRFAYANCVIEQVQHSVTLLSETYSCIYFAGQMTFVGSLRNRGHHLESIWFGCLLDWIEGFLPRLNTPEIYKCHPIYSLVRDRFFCSRKLRHLRIMQRSLSQGRNILRTRSAQRATIQTVQVTKVAMSHVPEIFNGNSRTDAQLFRH